MNIDKAIKICKDYNDLLKNRPYGYGIYPDEILCTCEKLKVLGRDWGEPLLCSDFEMYKGENIVLTNSATGYTFNPDEWYICWCNGNVGQLQFVHEHIFYDGFEKFLNKLHSYDPVDWDPYNCRIIYDIDNGKRVVNAYQKICDETAAEARKVTREYRARKLKEELDALESEE